MQNFILEMMNQYGYLGIYLLLLVESVFPPIPSEVILLFGGALTTTAALNLGQTILIATAGSLSGAIVLYLISHAVGAERLKKVFSGRTGKLLGLKPEYIDRSIQWFERYQNKAVFFCRCIPLMRSLISIPAGFAAMSVPQFVLLTALGSAIWNTLILCTGSALGAAWKTALLYIQEASLLVLLSAAMLSTACLVCRHIKKKKS